MINSPDSVVARVFKARYFPNSNFLNVVDMPGMSFMWRSILAGRNILSKGIRYQIGDGCNVSLWNDPWLPLPYSFKPFSYPAAGTECWTVGDIIDQENCTWIPEAVNELFTDEEANIILKIPLSTRRTNDRIAWHYNSQGIFNVKSGYHIAIFSGSS